MVALAGTLLSATGLFLATRDGPGLAGYVSESGEPGAPHAALYRIALLVLALTAGAAALALRPVAAPAASALAAAVPCLVVSGSVQCSAGCPLPPYQHPTPGDLVHAGASIAAVGCCGLAILISALVANEPRVRGVARYALVLMVPAGTAMAASLLLSGHTPLTGALERVCLVGCLGWVAATAAVLAGRGPTWDAPG